MGNIFGGGPPPPYHFIQCQGDDHLCCNGIDGLCDFGVDDIMWATSHNAMSSREGGLPALYNNLFELEDALETGYRGLGLDICNCNGEYQLCHGVCYLGARKPGEVFGNIVEFLNNNPTEFVLITLQIDNNADDPVSLDDFFDDLKLKAPSLLPLMYAHPAAAASWPSLGELKALGKVRVIAYDL